MSTSSITIRNIPSRVYEQIKHQAELHHRSINGEIIFYLTKMVQSQRRDPSQIIARAKKLKKKANGSLSIGEIQECIDNGRP